jgi:hypothetical protein
MQREAEVNVRGMPRTFGLRELRDSRGIHALDDPSQQLGIYGNWSFPLPIEKEIPNEQVTLSNNTGAPSGCRHALI